MNNIGYTCPSCYMFVGNLQVHNCAGFPAGESGFLSCEHCYCIPDKGLGGTNPHMKCCKCGNVMASQFIFKGDE